MKRLSGKLALPPGTEVARLLALTAEGRICAEALSDEDGNWRLDCPDDPVSVLAHTFRNGLAAATAAADDAAALVLPQGHDCEVGCEGADAHASFALDPVHLAGLAPEKVEAMRRQADGAVRLHIAEWPCASTPRRLALQAGRYRASGGSIALQLGAPAGTRLTGVTVGKEEIAPDAADFFEFDIDGPATIALRFEPRGAP